MIRGELPSSQVKLGDVVEFLDHRRRPITAKDRIPGEIPYYGANGQQDSVSGHIFDEPLVLLAEDGGYFDNPSRGIAYRIEGKSWVNNHAHVLRPRAGTDIAFLARILEHYNVRPFLTGTTRAKLTKAAASRIPISLPPLDEQRRIAAILDKADELRTKRREALAHLDALTQSIFHSMLGDAPPNALLSDAIGRLVGGKNVVGPDDSPNAFRVLKISSVTSGQYLETESKPLPEDYEPPRDHVVRDGDVIISRANTTELVGASALAESTNGTSVLPDKLWRAVPTSGTDSRFLVATLQSAAMRGEISRRSSGSGGSMKNISQPKLLSIPIALPPVELQQTFATRVAAVERLKEAHRMHLTELDALFSSLQHRAFKGEL